VLGTMKELGAHSVRLHRQVGQTVQDLSLDALLTLAEPAETEALASGASPVPTESFNDPHTLQERLKKLLQPGDCVLFKASRAIALDQVVNHLKVHFTNPSAPD
ncbi:MAG: UDP-N-acetylmuramoyl-tripeptide--D-alanyl-D-alanine ligase, partial [Cyanobacteria bacterium P01_E01_bin.43]